MWSILFNYIQLAHIIDEYGLIYVCPKAFSQKIHLYGFVQYDFVYVLLKKYIG